MEYRYATSSDLIKLYPGKVIPSIRAYVFTEGDVMLAIAGVKIVDGYQIAFSEILVPDLPKVKIWRGAKITMAMIVQKGLPAYAVCSTAQAGKFLERLGFTFEHQDIEGDVYLWVS